MVTFDVGVGSTGGASLHAQAFICIPPELVWSLDGPGAHSSFIFQFNLLDNSSLCGAFNLPYK